MDRVAELARRPPLAALVTGIWMVAFMPPSTQPLVWLAVPLCVFGVTLGVRLPMLGAVLVVAASGVCAFFGLQYGEIDMVLPAMYVLAIQGRNYDSILLGAATIAGITITTAMRPDAPWYAFLVALAVNSAPWVFGRVVRGRAHAAVGAALASAKLAEVDLERVMAQSAFTSHEHSADASHRVLRASLSSMCDLAANSRSASAAEAIRAEGQRAIEELHRILALLTDEPTQGSPPRTAEARAHRVWFAVSTDGSISIVRMLLAALATAISVTVAVVFAGWVPQLVLAALIVTASVWIAPRFAFAAPLVAGAALALMATAPAFHPDALLPLGACFVALVWILAGKNTVSAWAGLAAVTGGALILGLQFGRQGAGFVLVIAMLGFGASLAWRERDEIFHAEQARMVRLTASIASAKREADRAARRRVAHELHDGVSHGITAMTLQAQAARALAATDPVRSRRCMELVLEVGERTLHEIDALVEGWLNDEHGRPNLETLVDGVRTLGVPIEFRLSGEPDALSYRIVQESLTNITRYARGARVRIEVREQGGSRTVTIRDSGAETKGEFGSATHEATKWAVEATGRGSGLLHLADRVEGVGGTFRAGAVFSADGAQQGFEIRAEWPSEPAVLSAQFAMDRGE